MTYLLRKHKSIIFIILLLTIIFSMLYFLKNKNINAIPERATLVFNLFSIVGNI